MIDPTAAPALPDPYFRHEFGRLVSVLSRRFGMHRRELCEDAVQTALLRAVQSWSQQGPPDDKSAWLFRVAMNEVLGSLRREKRAATALDSVELVPGDVEAGIAAEHCLAPTYAETRWDEIARLYEMLDDVAPSPINTSNRSIAVGEWKGPAAGIALLESFEPPNWLLGYYLWDATLGELHRRRGDRERARVHLTRALDAAPTHAEKLLLRRRLDACVG